MSAPAVRWQRGDFAVVTYDGHSLDAMIVLSSTDARSLAIMFDGILGGFVGMMPILWSETRDTYVDLVLAVPVTLTVTTRRES